MDAAFFFLFPLLVILRRLLLAMRVLAFATLFFHLASRRRLTRYGGDDEAYTGLDDANSLEVYKDYDDFPGFVVPAGSLGFSVICFTACACVALAILAWRRKVRCWREKVATTVSRR